MEGKLMRNKKTAELVQVTHWDCSWVHRSTGKFWERAFCYEVLGGERQGKRFVEELPGWEQVWEPLWLAGEARW